MTPALCIRDALAFNAARAVPAAPKVQPEALPAAIEWLHRTCAATGGRGSSKGFSLLHGWMPAFPETTGYVIGTLLRYGRLAGEPKHGALALELGDWELGIQSADGGIVEGVLDGRHRESEAFNTGMVIHGWLDLYEWQAHDRHLEAADRAGRFLVASQADDGAWRGRHSYHGLPHTYMARVAWALVRLSRATGNDEFEHAAVRHLDWVGSVQAPNGWFSHCTFKPEAWPSTHAIAYTLRGLLESGLLLGESRFLDRVLVTSEVLIRKLEILGTLPSDWDSAWQPASRHVCLTGLAQLGGVWLRLFQARSDPRFLNAGLKAIELAADRQSRSRQLPVRGALPGSWPIYGRYAPLQYPNWATKFLADALMLRQACLEAT